MSLRLAAIQIICLVTEQTTTTGEKNVSMDVQEDYRLVLLSFPWRQVPAATEEGCGPREELLAEGAVGLLRS